MHYFTLLSLNLHLKQVSCFEQIWIGYRLPRDIVKETMKGYKLEETIAKERKKEKDWGKKWGLLQYGGKQSKIRLFPSILICFKFFHKNVFFWLKIFFDENFDDMNNFFQNFTKVVFL